LFSSLHPSLSSPLFPYTTLFRSILAQLAEGMVGVDLPLDGELHGLGREGRAVVERDALAELERVAETILRHRPRFGQPGHHVPRSEEHTSELQSRVDLVCRLLLE